MPCQLPLVTALLISWVAFSAPDTYAAQVNSAQITEIVKALASDEFEGRAPGGPGEEKTVAYLVDRFKALGLAPGGETGGWTHAVPLVHTQVQAPATMGFDTVDQHQALEQATDIAIETSRPRNQVIIDSAPVVFVGFGAKRMTYYGRWMYKFEEAERRGALAALVIHEDKAAAYGWSVAASGPGENYSIVRAEGSTPPVALQGWLHGDAAAQLFTSAGLDLDEQRVLARSPDFQAFELEGVTFSADLKITVKHIESQNVLAMLAGTTHSDEFLMVSSHWDAYGQGEPDAQGRTIRPGANDDALGTAGVLELARVLKAEAPLERSVVFAVWTAEESGLLGSTAYASNPVYPLEKTVANFTFDIMQTAGPAKDVILVGEGQSDLQGDLERAAAGQGRVVTPESLPENGLFFRADHFSMARGGVPVLLIMGIAGASDLVEGGRAAGEAWIAEYVGNCYHQTCDEWSPDWDLRGAIMDMELFHTIVRELGDSRRWPQWNPGSEFRAVRTKSDAVRSNR